MKTKVENKPSFADPLLDLIMQAECRYALFASPTDFARPVIVGVSGGIDSVVLLHALTQLAPLWHLQLHVAHVDHGLRTSSAEDAAFVHDLARRMGAPFHSTRLDAAALRSDASGLEAAARRARYRFLCAIAHDVTPDDMVPIVAVAHHANDQAETMLLRLIQGSGIEGLAGMRPVTILDDPALTMRPVRLVRPLLLASRTQIVEYAQRHLLSWREDESNLDPQQVRNLIRHHVMPALARINPRAVDAIARAADLVAEACGRLRAYDEQTLEELTLEQSSQRTVLRLDALQKMDVAGVRSLLHLSMARMRIDLRTIGAAKLERLANAIQHATHRSGPHPLGSGLAWSIVTLEGGVLALSLHRSDALPCAPPGPWLDAERRRQGEILLPFEGELALNGWRLQCTLLAPQDVTAEWRCNQDRWRAFFDADNVQTPVLTTPQAGLKIEPLGMAGKHRALGDLFTDAKIAPALRAGWPLLVDRSGDRVLWVCGLTQAHAARVTDATRRVWMVQWVKDAAAV
ncbi:MAG: tRNA lysidine(34) synthetase TilS [Caldilinea sp.]|nr:tRNA lysidine(34) synthetase TilS [Caldilinea sp.]MDW8440798.1 tRNA lysidine(34) synthetase TilS [Caldilineaceae bacterium]